MKQTRMMTTRTAMLRKKDIKGPEGATHMATLLKGDTKGPEGKTVRDRGHGTTSHRIDTVKRRKTQKIITKSQVATLVGGSATHYHAEYAAYIFALIVNEMAGE